MNHASQYDGTLNMEEPVEEYRRDSNSSMPSISLRTLSRLHDRFVQLDPLMFQENPYVENMSELLYPDSP